MREAGDGWPPRLDPEVELLLYCGRARLEPETAARVQELSGGELDWRALLRLAQGHGLSPLLYHHLNALCPEVVPAPILAALQDSHKLNARHNLLMAARLLALLRLLAGHGISAVPWKGPLLAVQAYGDLALREFSDLDLLVRGEDALRARDVLVAQGYRLEQAPRPDLEAHFMRSYRAFILLGPGRPRIDLQWALAPRSFAFALDLETLWPDLERSSLLGQEVWSLAAEDTVLALCAHDCRHLWNSFARLCDLAELVRANPDLRWDKVMGRARRSGGIRMLRLGLFLAQSLLDLELPSEVGRVVEADPALTGPARHVVTRLLGPLSGRPGIVECARFHTRARERLRDRALYTLYLATEPSTGDWDYVRLPRGLHLLYSPLHLLRLLRALLLPSTWRFGWLRPTRSRPEG